MRKKLKRANRIKESRLFMYIREHFKYIMPDWKL